MRHKITLAAVSALLFANAASAQQQVVGVTLADSGDTAWLLAATTLALLMVIPGILLFQMAHVSLKNLASVALHGFVIIAAVSLLWIIAGYPLAFNDGSILLGELSPAHLFLGGLAELRADTTVPESSYVLFEILPALIAPLLIMSAYAERVRFGWMVCFSVLWSLLVYIPQAHWLWGNGWLAQAGAHDFGGGLAMFASAGISALVIAKMIKPRIAPSQAVASAYPPALLMISLGLMLVGLYALNGAAALTASDDAATAMLNTHIAACAGALTWALIQRIRAVAPTSTGVAKGAIAGLAAITACAGFIGPLGALILGVLAAIVCRFVEGLIKKIDDSASVFALFGVGGIIGALAFPLLVLTSFGGPGYETDAALGAQMMAQITAVGAIVAWSAIVTLIVGLGITLVLPMRAEETN